MSEQNIQFIKQTIKDAYETMHPDRIHTGFGEVDTDVIKALIHGERSTMYDAINDCIQLAAIDLKGVPTSLVIVYHFNRYNDKSEKNFIPLELDAMSGGRLTELNKTVFNPSEDGALEKAIQRLYRRAQNIAEGTMV